MTVSRLLAEASSHELAQWMAFYKLEFDEERQRGLARTATEKLAMRSRSR